MLEEPGNRNITKIILQISRRAGEGHAGLWLAMLFDTICRRHDIKYRKPKSLHQKTIKTNKGIQQIVKYNYYIHKSDVFLYTNNELSKGEIRK